MPGEKIGPHEEYRGLSTDRGLTLLLNREDGYPGLGSLDMLGLAFRDLQGKVLDVGVGGGRSLRQAVERGIDYYGVDILPLLDAASIPSIRQVNILEMQRRFLKTASMYPNRMSAADFCLPSIPFAENSFDVVLSAGGLPGYARNAQEAIISVTNMLNLSRQKVAIHGGWDASNNASGTIRLGTAALGGQFSFNMKGFVERLRAYGISYVIASGIGPGGRLMNLHFDTSKKSPDFMQSRFGIIADTAAFAEG